MQAKNLYVIDDDEIFQFMILKRVKSVSRDIEVTNLGDGKKAINLLKNKINNTDDLPDIILLDINMPVIDGWEFIQFFKSFKIHLKKKITIYMVSSSKNPDDIEKAKEFEEISGYITKPVSQKELNILVADTPNREFYESTG